MFVYGGYMSAGSSRAAGEHRLECLNVSKPNLP